MDDLGFTSFGGLELFIVVLVVAYVYLFWRIIAKTGRSGALSLLLLIPIVNIGVFIWLAFSEWPIEKEANALRAQQRVGGSQYDLYTAQTGPPQR